MSGWRMERGVSGLVAQFLHYSYTTHILLVRYLYTTHILLARYLYITHIILVHYLYTIAYLWCHLSFSFGTSSLSPFPPPHWPSEMTPSMK